MVGAVFAIFLRRWLTIYTVLQPMWSKCRYLKKCPKPCWPIRSKDTWTKYTPLTLISQCRLALIVRNTLLAFKIIGTPKKFKIWPHTLLRPRTNHTWHQKPIPSRETVPLSFFSYLQYTFTTRLKYVRILNANREGWSRSTLPPLYKTHLYIWVPLYSGRTKYSACASKLSQV